MKKYYPVIIIGIIAVALMTCSITGVINENLGMSVALILVIILNIMVTIISFKNGVKIIALMMILCTIIGAILLGINIYSMLQESSDTYEFKIHATENVSPKTKLFTLDNRDYYTYNLSELQVELISKKEFVSLEEALKKGNVKFEDILKSSIANDNTDGYKVYYDGGGDTLDAYSITVCENNSDVIFSNFNYVYDESICKN